jgi:hypothetical protein
MLRNVMGDSERALGADERGPIESDDVGLDRGVMSTPFDMPIRTLLEEIKSHELTLNPAFQRKYVWGRDRQSKLVESLLLNMPIPALFFAEDDDGTKVVVDGQQRLRAIEDYHAGEYALKRLEILPELNGKRWRDLSPTQSRTILGRTLRCVVISATSPSELRFEMFERLSTGGMPINDQELRNCVFRGALNDLLHDLVRTEPWLAAVGKPDADLRMKHEELALRFFALRAVTNDYRPPVKHILNEYMRVHRNPDSMGVLALAAVFERALTNCVAVFGSDCFRRVGQAPGRPPRWEGSLNRAVFDLQMLSLADLSSELVRTNATTIRDVFIEQSVRNAEFRDAVTLGSADRPAFYLRLRLWIVALRDAGIEATLLERLPAS